MADARFRDAGEGPLRLRAESAEDLRVISALVQDAVLSSADIAWMPRRMRLALLVNRFRWEDRAAAEAARRPFERVRSVLIVGGALSVASNGIDQGDPDLLLSLLELSFEPGTDGAGTLHLFFSGDGEIRVDVECVDLSLRDVTRPYLAPSGKAPGHAE